MKNPHKQLIFTCFSAILRSRPRARFPFARGLLFSDRFCRYGALPPCLFVPAARRALYSPVPPDSHTHAPHKSASESAGKHKPRAYRLYILHVLPLLPPHVLSAAELVFSARFPQRKRPFRGFCAPQCPFQTTPPRAFRSAAEIYRLTFAPVAAPLFAHGFYIPSALPRRTLPLRLLRFIFLPNLPALCRSFFSHFSAPPRRTYFPPPDVFPVRMRSFFPQFTARPPQRRFRAANLRSRTDDSRIKQKSRRQQRFLIFLRHTPRHVAFSRPPQPKAQVKSA